MSYHVEFVTPTPTLGAIVSGVKKIDDIDRLPFPYCNEQMLRVDNGDYPHEEYMSSGVFKRTEKFYCDNCLTWADVSQFYEPNGRTMTVKRDVFDD